MDEQEQQQYEKQIGVEPNQEEQTLEPTEVQQTPTSPSHTKLIVGIVVAVLVVAGVVGAYFFINQRTYIESTAVNEEGSAFDDWKTYRNEEFGFEFQYPEEYEVRQLEFPGVYGTETGILVRSKENLNTALGWDTDGSSGDDFIIFPNNTSNDLADRIGIKVLPILASEEFFSNDENFYRPDMNQFVSAIRIGSRNGIQVLHDEYHKAKYSIFDNSDNTYFVITEIESKIYDSVFQTLRFIEANALNSSTWKTYRNEEFGFEFNYPRGVTVGEIEMSPNSNILLYVNVEYRDSTQFLLVKRNDERKELNEYVLSPYINCVPGPDGPCFPPPELTEFMLGDAAGVKDYNSYFFRRADIDNLIYVIGPGVTQPADENIFNEVFSTFKFTASN